MDTDRNATPNRSRQRLFLMQSKWRAIFTRSSSILLLVVLAAAAWAGSRLVEPGRPSDFPAAPKNSSGKQAAPASPAKLPTPSAPHKLVDIPEVELEYKAPPKSVSAPSAILPPAGLDVPAKIPAPAETENAKESVDVPLGELPVWPPLKPNAPAPPAAADPVPSDSDQPTPAVRPLVPAGLVLPSPPFLVDLTNVAPEKKPALKDADIDPYGDYVVGAVDPAGTLDVIQGRTRVLVLKGTPKRIHVASKEIAACSTSGNNDVTLTGMQVGATVVNLWFPAIDDNKKEAVVAYLVRVIPDPEVRLQQERVFKSLEHDINQEIPGSRIQLKLLGDAILVTGLAPNAYEAEQVIRIVSANAPSVPHDAGAARTSDPRHPRVINMIRLGRDQPPPVEQVSNSSIAAKTPAAAAKHVERPHGHGDQVKLKIAIAELNRATASKLGIKLNLSRQAASVDRGQNLRALQSLVQAKHASVLADPSLVAPVGQIAKVQAGGQMGSPGANSGGSATPYGVQATFKPLLVERDRTRLEVCVRLGAGQAKAGNAGARDFCTTVEVKHGETLALPGLSLANSSMPRGLISMLRDSDGEPELVIFITPEFLPPTASDPRQTAEK